MSSTAERRRVAVVGMGVKTPAGNDLETFWQTILSARSQAGTWTIVDPELVPVKFGCEVKDFDAEAYLGTKEARRQDRVAQLGYAAARDALDQAGEIGADPARCGVVVGTGVGGLQTLESQIVLRHEKGAERVSPFLVPMMMTNATAGLISIQQRWTGPSLCVTTACAAGANAIGEASRMIRWGEVDVVVTGGTESSITPTAIGAFARMGALSGRNDDPTAASRPFDIGRDGFVMGEAAAFLVLEEWDRAVARGATILGEIVGYGRNCDAHHITAPSPGGAGAVACMQSAIDDSGLSPADIGHINAHGTSTPLNDAAESEAVLKVLGETVPMTSTKGVTGHTIGAAGAVEAVATLLSIRYGIVPPVANLEQLDPAITADVVQGSPREIDPAKAAISNSFGFGGHNASLVIAGA